MFLLLLTSVLALADDEEAPVPDALSEVEAPGFAPVEPLAEEEPLSVVLQGGTVLTASGETFEPGYVVLVDGAIASVGAGEPEAVPDGAMVKDVSGHFVTPGLIDTHSHLGVYPSPYGLAHSDGNEATAPTTPGVWAEHSFWPQDPGLQGALEGGITALQALPGSANLIGGRGVVLQMVPARGSRAMRFPDAPETVKMACGENPKRVYGHHLKTAPSTRMGNLRGQRMAFVEARRYLDEWEAYAEKKARWDATPDKKRSRKGMEEPEPPERDLDKDTLAGVLSGQILPQIHCYRADDLISFVQLADEFDFSIRSFHHCLEAYKVRDVLADEEIACSTWADWWGFKLEAYDGIMENAALLTESGARAIIHSDSSEDIQRLNQEAAKAYYAGLHAGIELSEDDALKWVTLHPAWALGIDDQTGSLEVGKRADVVVWDAHPFDVTARARWVFVEGVLRHDADQEPVIWSDFQLGQEVTP